MSVFFTAKRSDVPQDCKSISKRDVELAFVNCVSEWDDWTEVKFLRHGGDALGAVGGATGFYFNRYYRQKLKLGNYGFLSTYLPIIVLPAFMTVAYHKTFIVPEVYSWHPTKCLTCLQAKAAGFQAFLGTIQPAILAPLSSFMFATRHFTYRIPYPFSKPKEFIRFYIKLTRPLVSAMAIACGLHFITASAITYLELQEFMELQQIILEPVPAEARPPAKTTAPDIEYS